MVTERDLMRQREYVQRVYVDGYTLARYPSAEHESGKETVAIVAKGDGTCAKNYDPMKRIGLYREFADLDYLNEEAILAFVGKYGFLEEATSGVQTERRALFGNGDLRLQRHFELLWNVQRAAYDMRQILLTIDAIRSRKGYELAVLTDGFRELLPIHTGCSRGLDQRGLHVENVMLQATPESSLEKSVRRLRAYDYHLPPADELVADAAVVVAEDIECYLLGATHFRIDCSQPLAPKMQIQPRNLLGAMFLQAAQDFTGELVPRKCLLCDKWFDVGAGEDANKATRLYCSDTCRMKAYRLRKKRALSRADSRPALT
jgi:hypothetical protein